VEKAVCLALPGAQSKDWTISKIHVLLTLHAEVVVYYPRLPSQPPEVFFVPEQ
jgi:hypothetical protein